MKISIIHPSYKRPELAYQAFNEWMLKAKDKCNIEYVLSLAANDPFLGQYLTVFGDKATICISDTNGLVIQANNGAETACGDLLVCISDDFGCPNEWDYNLLQHLQGKINYAVKTDDGIQPFIMTLPIVDRAFYQSVGHIYHPDYNHMYGDEELAEVARMTHRYIKVPLIFPHRHYSTGQMQKDEVNKRNDSFLLIDKQTFIKRKANGFINTHTNNS